MKLSDWVSLQERMRSVFNLASSKRHEMDDWISFEREKMYEAVNTERTALGKPAKTIDDIMRIENCAVGHVDYARKFSLYCAELVVEE